jgi:Uma2 family endonuclease
MARGPGSAAKIGLPNIHPGAIMLEEGIRLPLSAEDYLPDSDGKPVDNELQVLGPVLLRAILSYIWSARFDWFFGVNLGVYYDPDRPAIGPDGFLSLGVQRVRPENKLRLSYIVAQEQVMPQWVLEIVSKQPGGEYGEKFERYAAMGVLYYTIYNPSHHRRDRHDAFEVYKLEQGEYVRQQGNPIWLPEIGLGIGHEIGTQEGIRRDWLYWYDETGTRHLAPEDALAQERILREREKLMRREAEAQLAQAEAQLAQSEAQLARAEAARVQTEQALAQAQLQSAQTVVEERRSLALKMLQAGAALDFVTTVTGFTLEQLQGFRSDSQ